MAKRRDPEEVARISACWGIRPYAVTPVRAAYRVAGPDGVVALKASRKDAKRLKLLDQAFRHLEAAGFHKSAPLLPTRRGEPFVSWGEELWTASPWREGREPEYRLSGDLARCVVTLAGFHLCGLGFRPTGVSLRNALGRWPEKLRRRAGEVRQYLARVGETPAADDFQLILRRLGPTLLRQAELASTSLERTDYARRCAWAEEARPLCHGDASNRNFILGADGVAYLIDLESLKLDLPEIDLCRLLRRTLRRTGWKLEVAREILAAYSRFAPLETPAKAIILALLHFPDKAWRLMKQYFGAQGPHENEDEEKNGPSVRRLTCKLRRVEEELPAWQSFLQGFAEWYGLGGVMATER
ncbi:MAG TPA: phosphotransferase [Firmicutes bacterium]|nr:phosphotransferase [Bacillota bacterium]